MGKQQKGRQEEEAERMARGRSRKDCKRKKQEGRQEEEAERSRTDGKEGERTGQAS